MKKIIGIGVASVLTVSCGLGERPGIMEEGDFTLSVQPQQEQAAPVHTGEHGFIQFGDAILNLNVYHDPSSASSASLTNSELYTRDEDLEKVLAFPDGCRVNPVFDEDGSPDTQDDRHAADWYGGFVINSTRGVSEMSGPAGVSLNYIADPEDKPQYVPDPATDELVRQIEANQGIVDIYFEEDGRQFSIGAGLADTDFEGGRVKSEAVGRLHAATAQAVEDLYAYCGAGLEAAGIVASDVQYELYPDMRMTGNIIVNGQSATIESSYSGGLWSDIEIASGVKDETTFQTKGISIPCAITQEFEIDGEPHTSGNFTIHPASEAKDAIVYDQTQATSFMTSREPVAGTPVIDQILASETVDYYTFTEDSRVSAHVRDMQAFDRDGRVRSEAVKGMHQDLQAVLEAIDADCASR